MVGRLILGGFAIGLLAWLLCFMMLRGLGQGGVIHEPLTDLLPRRLSGVPQKDHSRVLILGTSLTAKGRWTDVLAARLSLCHLAGVTVERLAKSGANSVWGEGALRQRFASGQVPDALVIEFSINDSSLWRGMPLSASYDRHKSMLALAQQAGVPVWLATMSPAFGYKAWERPGQSAYRRGYARLADESGAGLIAMVPDWLSLPISERNRLIPDGLHPTEEAMERIAVPAITRALAPALCR